METTTVDCCTSSLAATAASCRLASRADMSSARLTLTQLTKTTRLVGHAHIHGYTMHRPWCHSRPTIVEGATQQADGRIGRQTNRDQHTGTWTSRADATAAHTADLSLQMRITLSMSATALASAAYSAGIWLTKLGRQPAQPPLPSVQ